MNDIYEKAKRYYPTIWNINMLRNLVRLGKLTQEQFNEIVGAE